MQGDVSARIANATRGLRRDGKGVPPSYGGGVFTFLRLDLVLYYGRRGCVNSSGAQPHSSSLRPT